MGQLDHGYAVTVHKAQGRTVTHALLLSSDGASRELGYVGLSRGTTSNHLYLEDAGARADAAGCVPRPASRTQPPMPVVRRLTRSRSQQLASEHPPGRAGAEGRTR